MLGFSALSEDSIASQSSQGLGAIVFCGAASSAIITTTIRVVAAPTFVTGATGTLTNKITATASVTATTVASPALTTKIPLSGAIASTAYYSAALNASVLAVAAIASVTTSTATLSVKTQFAASALATVTPNVVLKTGIPLNGSIASGTSMSAAYLFTNWILNVSETISSSGTLNDVLYDYLDHWTTTDSLSNNLQKNFAESLHAIDVEHKNYSLNETETLHSIDAYIKRANAVYSNMIVNNADLTQTQFDNIADNGQIIGYTDFKDFVPGDYTFQHGLYRVILTSTNSDRARLDSMLVSVDVPDVFDRGSGAVTVAGSGGVTIPFTRQFDIVPNIVLTMQGGTVIALPQIIGTTTITGGANGFGQFTTLLVNPSTGLGVTGTFTWAAHGY